MPVHLTLDEQKYSEELRQMSEASQKLKESVEERFQASHKLDQLKKVTSEGYYQDE